MHLTVGICTWNRADLLDGTLDSLAQVVVPSGVTWDVIVANNNSTDHTEDVLDRHVPQLPLTRLFVPQQGKSHALNEVVRRLTGDLVLWTDDDVRFSPDWIAAYVDAARRWPEAEFFGGRIVPRFLGEEPDWLRPAWRAVAGVFGARELGDAPFPFDRKHLPFGANMAARVALQKQYRYNPNLGRRGNLLFAGEETALLEQWLADGHRGIWVPQACVEHLVPPERLNLDYLRRFYFGMGKSKHPYGKPGRAIGPLFRGLWYAAQVLKYRTLSLFYPRATHPCLWMKYLARININRGRVESQWGESPLKNFMLAPKTAPPARRKAA